MFALSILMCRKSISMPIQQCCSLLADVDIMYNNVRIDHAIEAEDSNFTG